MRPSTMGSPRSMGFTGFDERGSRPPSPDTAEHHPLDSPADGAAVAVAVLRPGAQPLPSRNCCVRSFSLTGVRPCVRDCSRLGVYAFRRALDRGNVTEALSAASELNFVGLSEALELTLLLVDGDLEKYNRAALRWHIRFVEETKNVDIRESQAVLALLTTIPANALAAAALAELLSRRGSCERIAEALVGWSRAS